VDSSCGSYVFDPCMPSQNIVPTRLKMEDFLSSNVVSLDAIFRQERNLPTNYNLGDLLSDVMASSRL